jgi:phage terminase large subunit-like protein
LALPKEVKSARRAPKTKTTKTPKKASPSLRSKYPHCFAGIDYCKAVVAGIIPACLFVQQACKRHLDDLERKNWPYEFDYAKGEAVAEFTCEFQHIKGPLAGTNITLEGWQSFLLTCVFGWVFKSTGKRRFRRVYVEVPRGNGKTTISVAPALYMLAADGEGGAEVYSAARVKDQAKIAFGLGQQMARKCPDFREALGVEVVAHRIVQASSASFFEAVSSDADSLDGKNVHFGLIDEVHAHRSRDVYDAIETGCGKRDQALLWAITTAGSDKTGIAYEQRAYVINILKGLVQDESYFGIVYTVDDGDDWTDPEIHRKANPNYGVSVEEKNLTDMCLKAKHSPASQAAFLTKHLNVWIQTDQALYDTQAWAKCGNSTLKIEDYYGKPCRIALDLASKIDIAAKSLLFDEPDGTVTAFPRFYLPQAAIDKSKNASYAGWQIEGHIKVTDGDVIDFNQIESDIHEDMSNFDVLEIGVDPWQSTQMSTSLMGLGANVVEFRQVLANFSEPTKELDAMMREGRIVHDGNPVMAWMIGNVVGHYDAKENVYPRKERQENKIDGAVSLIMALGLKLKGEVQQSSYLSSSDLLILG